VYFFEKNQKLLLTGELGLKDPQSFSALFIIAEGIGRRPQQMTSAVNPLPIHSA
jgi:hypothetical protein